jgi:hypothetical protein
MGILRATSAECCVDSAADDRVARGGRFLGPTRLLGEFAGGLEQISQQRHGLVDGFVVDPACCFRNHIGIRVLEKGLQAGVFESAKGYGRPDPNRGAFVVEGPEEFLRLIHSNESGDERVTECGIIRRTFSERFEERWGCSLFVEIS